VTDPLLRMVESLPHAEPDSARTSRVRARCHAALARRRRAAVRTRATRVTETVLAGLGAIYLIETIRQAMLYFGIA
jgi:hypothetical protein